MVGSVSGRFLSLCVLVWRRRACQSETLSSLSQSEITEEKERSQSGGRKKDRPPARPVPDVLCALRQDSKCVGVCN